MTTFLRLLRAELLKLKNTPLLAVVICVALMPATTVSLIYFTRSDGMTVWQWNSFLQSSMQIWLQLVVALFIGILAAQYLAIEHGNNTWKILFTLPASKTLVVLAKWCVTLMLIMIAFVILGLSLYGGAVLLQLFNSEAKLIPQAFDHITRDLGMLIATVIASMGIITIQYILALVVRAMSVPIIVAVAGFMVASMSAGRELMLHLWPWAWPYQVYLQTANSSDARVSISYALMASLAITVVGLVCLLVYIRQRDEI